MLTSGSERTSVYSREMWGDQRAKPSELFSWQRGLDLSQWVRFFTTPPDKSTTFPLPFPKWPFSHIEASLGLAQPPCLSFDDDSPSQGSWLPGKIQAGNKIQPVFLKSSPTQQEALWTLFGVSFKTHVSFGSRVKSVLLIPKRSRDSHKKLCLWTTFTQGGGLPFTPDSGSHRPRNGRLGGHFWVCCDVVEAIADHNSCYLCSPRVELSAEKCLPPIGTDDFFLSWLDCYFLFNLPSGKLTTKTHGLRTATAQSHRPQTCIQLLCMVLTFHLSWLFVCIFFFNCGKSHII